MRVTFDTENTSVECPDHGLITRADCEDCEYFVEMDGFDVICNFEEPIQEEE